MSTGTIRLVRPWQYKNYLRAYRVYIDNAKVGVIKNDRVLLHRVKPGLHLVQVRIDLCRSNKLQVEVGKGQTSSVEICTRNIRDWQTWVGWGITVTFFGMGIVTGSLIGWIIFSGCGALILGIVLSTPYLRPSNKSLTDEGSNVAAGE